MAKDDYTAGTYSQLLETEEKKKKLVSPTPKTETPEGVEAKTPRHRGIIQPLNQDGLIETIRRAVKELGKEAATYRFTQKEKKALANIVYSFKSKDKAIKTSENEITRIAINFLVEDYRKNGKGSILARVLERLNA